MKRIISILLAILMCLSVVSCSSNDELDYNYHFHDFSDDSLGIQDIITTSSETDDNSAKKVNKNQKNCPTLYKYGRDMTESARQNKIDPIIGRDKETERVIQIL